MINGVLIMAESVLRAGGFH